MAGQQISNPSGAFGYSSITDKGPRDTMEFSAGGTITGSPTGVGVPVSITSTGTVIATATDGVAIVGVSYGAATSGKTLQAIVRGVALVSAGGVTTLGTPVIRSATTAGYVTSSASPAAGTVVGFALGASSGGNSYIWVAPGTNTTI